MAKKNGAAPVVELDDIAVRTLSGDIRDFVLNKLRYEQDKRPWAERSEQEQRDTIGAATVAAEDLVRHVVALVAGAGLPSIGGSLDAVAMKGTVKATILLSSEDEERMLDLTRMASGHQGKAVTMVLADYATFLRARGKVPVRKDQPALAPELDPSPEADEDGVVQEATHEDGGPVIVQPEESEGGADPLQFGDSAAANAGTSRQ